MMLNRIQSKLKSNRGVSILLVLVLFLLCVMISSIIVVAASSGASRNEKRADQQKGYLAVISAAELIVDEMTSAGEFVGLEQNLDYGCNITGDLQYVSDASRFDEQFVDVPEGDPEEDEGEPEPAPAEGEGAEDPAPAPTAEPLHSDITKDSGADIWQVDIEKTALDGAFKDLLTKACTDIYDAKATSYSTTFTIESDDDRLPDVDCTFEMNKDYYITIKLSSAGSSYEVKITFNAALALEEETKDIACNHYIKYRKILGDGSIDTEYTTELVSGIAGKQKSIRTKVTWSLHEFTKGG